ncbi:DUF2779 domain-containing protein [Bacteriovorax sp. PP10]|uniref:DUF2779 domain-containing protein n=1 Tax=Bacteriovorax antarcticus TaxID=3088717 RepID=A0ABU5VWB8_9BACT|nr:DUF2779 domain-containing protein [Bacteriovorax sp. PP10]MEA9357256.1 DUF2779 domain-containing protein [Bacteriovorax sp. PP10]
MRYLTKSRFKMALECPTKLYYTKKPKEYADSSIDDPFMEALAKGGFQVGELAKLYYPDGVEVRGLDFDKTWEETQALLKNENVIIYEAAIKYKNLFIRIDVLKKTGKKIELIEAKSKSFSGSTFATDVWQKAKLKKNEYQVASDWKPYIFDVAFQTYVLNLAFPEFTVIPFLMCADKDLVASSDGLNQKFLIGKDEKSRTKITIMGKTDLSSLGTPILTAVDVSEVVSKIHNNTEESEIYGELNFKDAVAFFADHYERDVRIVSEVDKACKGCEFRTDDKKLKNGFNECWKAHGLSAEELNKTFVFDMWYGPKVLNDKIFVEDLDENDFEVKENEPGVDGLNRSQRQWLQMDKIIRDDGSEHKDQDGINREFSTYTFPLHFIDFETSMVAIPFNKGRRPYEQMAFQFSHHEMDKDGKYHHAGEWISTTPGEFPNFNFVRALKKQLENDNGTIFRYSNHENTVLSQIIVQLQKSLEPDREELISWIKTITKNNDKVGGWKGDRCMVDLCEVVKKFYYHPETHGSNSIKYVLPAVLKMQGKDPDPYGSLPAIFRDYDASTIDFIMKNDDSGDGGEQLSNGGAAMMAYALMQFTEMSDEERRLIKEALLRYCKLDTEAMVWIYQYLRGTNDDK